MLSAPRDKLKGWLSSQRLLKIAVIAIFMGFLGAVTAFSVFPNSGGGPSGYRLSVGGETVTMCLPGDQLSHSTWLHEPGAEGLSDTWQAAQGVAADIREDAVSSELSQDLREVLAPARDFSFDADTVQRRTASVGVDIVTYDSTKVDTDGDEVLTARIVLEDTDDGAFIHEVLVCSSETSTSVGALESALDDFYGPIPAGTKTEEERD